MWDNLRKRMWHGPSRCSMCEAKEESNLHSFFKCRAFSQIWHDLALLYDFPHFVFDSIQSAFDWWCGKFFFRRPILIIMLWCAWRWRNNKIFKESKLPLKSILQHIIYTYDSMPKKLPSMKRCNREAKDVSLAGFPRAFFDGAE